MAEALSGVNGNIIRWAREFYNMSPDDAAQAIGVDVTRYSNWESGTEHPTYAKLKKSVMFFANQARYSFFLNPRLSLQ